MNQRILTQRGLATIALLIAVVVLVVALLFMLKLSVVQADIGDFQDVHVYTYETIVDTSGAYGDELPADIRGTIVGMTVFRQEANQAWYPVIWNGPYDDDNIVENISFGDDGQFGGYFRHNEDGWTPIQEHIGKRLRIVLFVR